MSERLEIRSGMLEESGTSFSEMLVELVVVPLGLSLAGFVVYDLLSGFAWVLRALAL